MERLNAGPNLLLLLVAPQQLPVSLGKINRVMIAGVVGYWLDRALSLYARPESWPEGQAAMIAVALVGYDKWLRDRLPAAYNSGLGWVQRERLNQETPARAGSATSNATTPGAKKITLMLLRQRHII